MFVDLQEVDFSSNPVQFWLENITHSEHASDDTLNQSNSDSKARIEPLLAPYKLPRRSSSSVFRAHHCLPLLVLVKNQWIQFSSLEVDDPSHRKFRRQNRDDEKRTLNHVS